MTDAQTFIIHYAEIGLKGKNRRNFEFQLIDNIKHTLGSSLHAIQRQHGQIVLRTIAKQDTRTIKNLKKIFGIAWFAPVISCPSNINAITRTATKLAQQIIEPHTTFAIRARRSSKDLPFTSLDIEKQVGEMVRRTTQAQVNLNHPHTIIRMIVGKGQAFLYAKKYQGSGGLPVGTSGKVLSLLSGGFDSIASSYLLAKRGAQVDFLHFHIFPDHQRVLLSKINTVVNQLVSYTLSSRLFLASYTPYQLATLKLPPLLQKQELIVFRRLMVKVGEQLAQKHSYQALVLGDSLGQVASQTLENIVAVDQAVNIPVFRPLIGSDKKDIMSLVRGLELEDVVNQKYQDCCSIVASHPTTKANLKYIHQIEMDLNNQLLVEQMVKQLEMVPVK